MCDCTEGRVIVTHDREDAAATNVVRAIQDNQVPGVAYTASMDDLLEGAGREYRAGHHNLHLLAVEEGTELWAVGDLQFRYQNAFLSDFEAGYQPRGSFGYDLFTDPRRHMVSAPDSAVYLTQNTGSFQFDSAVHNAYKTLLKLPGTAVPGQTGSGVQIAVIDTGLDPQAAAVAGAASRSFHDDSASTSVNDTNGHGTAVASIIHDVAPDADLTVLKIGDHNRLSEWNLAAAMLWGASADVINLSVAYSLAAQDCYSCGRQQSHSSRSAVFERVVNDVRLANPEALIVAAAGNRKQQVVDFPARYSDVVAVGAVTSAKNVASYSNTGATDHTGGRHDHVFFAPGGDTGEVVGTTVDPSGQTTDRTGTSFAAPYVAAMVAIELERGGTPRRSASAILADFQHRADTSITGYRQSIHGNGLIQL